MDKSCMDIKVEDAINETKMEINGKIKDETLEFENMEVFDLEDAVTDESQENKHSILFYDGITENESSIKPVVRGKKRSKNINGTNNSIAFNLPGKVRDYEVNNCVKNLSCRPNQVQTGCKIEKSFKCSEFDYLSAVYDEGRRYICNECNYRFSDKFGLSIHERSVHEKIKPFKCNECAYTCSVKGSLTLHINSVHLNLKPIKCSECDYSCNQKCTMVKHLQSSIHRILKTFICSDCNSVFRSKKSLLIHLRAVHKMKPYICSKCNISYTLKRSLFNHVRSAHGKINPFKCNKCAYTCNVKKSLTQHYNASHSYECRKCSYTCGKESILMKHVSSVDVTKKLKTLQWKISDCPFGQENVLSKSCKKVKKTSTALSSSSSGTQSLDGKIDLFKCSECDYSCRVKGSLPIHIKLMHTL